MPGMAVNLLIREGLFVKNRSKMFASLVGKYIIWISPRSPSSVRNASLMGADNCIVWSVYVWEVKVSSDPMTPSLNLWLYTKSRDNGTGRNKKTTTKKSCPFSWFFH